MPSHENSSENITEITTVAEIRANISYLKAQVNKNYRDESLAHLRANLLYRIDLLNTLAAKPTNSDKESLVLAYKILEKVSSGNFGDKLDSLDQDLRELERIGKQDARQFSWVRTILNTIIFPALVPILFIQMVIALLQAYEYTIFLQAALISAVVVCTLLYLTASMLAVTVSLGFIAGSLLSDFVLGRRLGQNMLENIKDVLLNLFYKSDQELLELLDGISQDSLDARYQLEGGYPTRLVNSIVSPIRVWFNNLSIVKKVRGIESELSSPVSLDTDGFNLEAEFESPSIAIASVTAPVTHSWVLVTNEGREIPAISYSRSSDSLQESSRTPQIGRPAFLPSSQIIEDRIKAMELVHQLDTQEARTCSPS